MGRLLTSGFMAISILALLGTNGLSYRCIHLGTTCHAKNRREVSTLATS
jgi:hypothetical protein